MLITQEDFIYIHNCLLFILILNHIIFLQRYIHPYVKYIYILYNLI